jgi:tetratricopeptide (TPR) repeat protein
MDWSALVEGLLSCHPGNEQLHRIVLILGGLASVATIAAAIYRLWRWLLGPPLAHRHAARALRQQGAYQARFNHSQQAMELYNFSIRLNPRAAEAYYLRGCLKEDLEQINRAIADWKRCLRSHPRHAGAIQKLGQYGVTGAGSGLPSWALAVGAGTGAVVIMVLVGAYAL